MENSSWSTLPVKFNMLYYDDSHITHENGKLTVCVSCFHSIMTYRITFWGNSADKNSVFYFKKKRIKNSK
jgi:hypothetical protein